MVPVNVSESWYNDKGSQLFKEINTQLDGSKRFIGLLIAGISALVTLIASSTAAAFALPHSIQTAHHVNMLSKNVSQILGTQEFIDVKIEQKLNALYDTVNILGDELQGLKLKLSLDCHASYKWISVTPKPYNGSTHSWDRVRRHLAGVWHNANSSLDLIQLHNEILSLRNAAPLEDDLSTVAGSFVRSLLSKVLSVNSWMNSLIAIACGGAVLFLCILCFPCCLRLLCKDIRTLQLALHEMRLTSPKSGAPSVKNKKREMWELPRIGGPVGNP